MSDDPRPDAPDQSASVAAEPVPETVTQTLTDTVTESAGETVDDAAPPKAGLVTRVKTSADSMKTSAEDMLENLESKRPTNRIIDVAFGSAEYEANAGGGILAGAVAFRFFLFVVPYVFVVIFGFGVGANAAGQDPTELARKSGIVGLAASAIDSTSNATKFAQWATFFVALYALILGSRNLVKSLRAVHAIIWHVPFTKLKGATTKGLVAIVGITVVLLFSKFSAWIRDQSVLLFLLAMVFTVAVPAAVWLYFSTTLFPSAEGTTWRDLWPGALLFGVGVQLLQVVTIVWISRSLESKSETYGALGAALTILLWAYMLGRLVTTAASLNAVMWSAKHRLPLEPPTLATAVDDVEEYEHELHAPEAAPFAPPTGPPAG